MVKLFGSYPTYSVRASHTLNLGYFDGFGQFSASRNSEPIATVFYGESVIAGQRWWLLPSMASSPPPCPSSMERHPAALLLLPSSFPTLFHWLIIFCQLREKGIITYIVLTNYWISSLNIFLHFQLLEKCSLFQLKPMDLFLIMRKRLWYGCVHAHACAKMYIKLWERGGKNYFQTSTLLFGKKKMSKWW